MSLNIANGQHVGSVPLHLHYNTAVLQYVKYSKGPFLEADGTSAVMFANDTGGGGEVVVGLSRLQGGVGASGNGVLAAFEFLAVGPGSAGFAFTGASVRDGQAKVVPAQFSAVPVNVEPCRKTIRIRNDKYRRKGDTIRRQFIDERRRVIGDDIDAVERGCVNEHGHSARVHIEVIDTEVRRAERKVLMIVTTVGQGKRRHGSDLVRYDDRIAVTGFHQCKVDFSVDLERRNIAISQAWGTVTTGRGIIGLDQFLSYATDVIIDRRHIVDICVLDRADRERGLRQQQQHCRQAKPL